MKHGTHRVCGGSVTFFYEEAKLLSLSPSWEGGGRPLASLACQEHRCHYSLSCPCSLTAFALCSSVQRMQQHGCRQQRSKQTLEQNRKCVLMQASLIMESKRRDLLNINYISCWEEREHTAPLQRGNMKGEAFQSLHHSPIKQNLGYFTVTTRFSQAVG